MRSLDDTIVAVSTPAGPAPRAIVRLSGPRAFAILGSALAEPRPDLAALASYSAIEARVRLGRGEPAIPATLYVMPCPRSYTRQDTVEVHTLGSTPLLRMLVDSLVQRGARVAEPGEFTRRAFLNGRIDLAQAEAVLALIQATSAAEARAATRALRGDASRRIHELHERLVRLRARVEAAIDFAEHDIEVVAPGDVRAGIEHAQAAIARMLREGDTGALPPEGVRVAICGLPNAGKSSLFNALLGRRRAIVTDVAGTTRDAVDEPLTLDGVRFLLHDTAGIHPPADANASGRAGFATLSDAIDAEAMSRARGLIAGAQIALVVLDASQPLTHVERRLWHEVHAPHKLLLLNKSDLLPAISSADIAALALPDSDPHSAVRKPQSAPFAVSALTGAGLPQLRAALVALVRSGRVEAPPCDLILNARHREALLHAREALGRAVEAIEQGMGEEFVALDLRAAHDALGAITGHVAPDDLLDRIFAQFCIGK